MIVVRFKVAAQPSKAEEVAAALRAVVAPSRRLDGLIHFDIGRDLPDETVFIATEVFQDRAALERQEALPEVGRVLELLPSSVTSEPEAAIYEIASSQPWG